MAMMNPACNLDWPDQKNTFAKCLKEEAGNTNTADAVIICDGKQFHVHKVIFAIASPFFRTIFESHVALEKPYITITDVRQEVMTKILQYVYYGNVGVPNHMRYIVYSAVKALELKMPQKMHPGYPLEDCTKFNYDYESKEFRHSEHNTPKRYPIFRACDQILEGKENSRTYPHSFSGGGSMTNKSLPSNDITRRVEHTKPPQRRQPAPANPTDVSKLEYYGSFNPNLGGNESNNEEGSNNDRKRKRSNGNQCPFCEKEFASKGNIARHIRTVHDMNRERSRHVCPTANCRRLFTNIEVLEEHLRAQHPDFKAMQESIQAVQKSPLKKESVNIIDPQSEKNTVTQVQNSRCGSMSNQSIHANNIIRKVENTKPPQYNKSFSGAGENRKVAVQHDQTSSKSKHEQFLETEIISSTTTAEVHNTPSPRRLVDIKQEVMSPSLGNNSGISVIESPSANFHLPPTPTTGEAEDQGENEFQETAVIDEKLPYRHEQSSNSSAILPTFQYTFTTIETPSSISTDGNYHRLPSENHQNFGGDDYEMSNQDLPNPVESSQVLIPSESLIDEHYIIHQQTESSYHSEEDMMEEDSLDAKNYNNIEQMDNYQNQGKIHGNSLDSNRTTRQIDNITNQTLDEDDYVVPDIEEEEIQTYTQL